MVKRKPVVKDPEGNKIITKTRKTNLFGPKGATKVIVKYADKSSSGKRKDVQTFSAPTPTDDMVYKQKGGAKKKMQYGGPKKKMKKYQSLGEVISGPLNQNEQAMYDRTVTYKDKMPNVDLQKLRNTLVTKGLDQNSSKKSTKDIMKARELKKISQQKMKTKKMKTGGMVNSNTKVSALKSAGSKGVRSGVNKRATVKRK